MKDNVTKFPSMWALSGWLQCVGGMLGSISSIIFIEQWLLSEHFLPRMHYVQCKVFTFSCAKFSCGISVWYHSITDNRIHFWMSRNTPARLLSYWTGNLERGLQKGKKKKPRPFPTLFEHIDQDDLAVMSFLHYLKSSRLAWIVWTYWSSFLCVWKPLHTTFRQYWSWEWQTGSCNIATNRTKPTNLSAQHLVNFSSIWYLIPWYDHEC